jgi:hypothetical protein
VKLVFSLILTLVIEQHLLAREIIQIQINNQSNGERIKELNKTLENQLGIPKGFISVLHTQDRICSLRDRKIVIGICVEKKNVRVFYTNRELYRRSIKKIIDLHLLKDS